MDGIIVLDGPLPKLQDETRPYAFLRYASEDLAKPKKEYVGAPPAWAEVAPGCTLDGGWGDDD